MSNSTPKKNTSNKYLKFSGIAFQLALLLFLAIWGGSKLDIYMNNTKQYMTALFVVLAFTGFIFNLMRDLNSMK